MDSRACLDTAVEMEKIISLQGIEL